MRNISDLFLFSPFLFFFLYSFHHLPFILFLRFYQKSIRRPDVKFSMQDQSRRKMRSNDDWSWNNLRVSR